MYVTGFDQCSHLILNNNGESVLWKLGSCEYKFPFVCEAKSCISGQFRCKDGSKCIGSSLICDGQLDCPDQSDEYHCRGNDIDTIIKIKIGVGRL